MPKLEDTLRRFWNFYQERRVTKAILAAIPVIGESLVIMVEGGTIEDLIKESQGKTTQQQQEIVSKLETIMEQIVEHPRHILTVGGGNGEYLLRLDGDLQIGGKHIVTCHEFLGGSGVNYTLRLANAGFPVLPILSIGKDRLGHNVREEILFSARKAKFPESVLKFIDSDEFFVPNVKTPLANIVVEKAQRTIFTERISGNENFGEYVKRRLVYLDSQPDMGISAVVIGHIYADSPDLNPSHPGECTRHIIQSFCDKSLVFANFGNSQIRMGVDFWENDLKALSVCQLNLDEMKKLFAQKNPRISLADIVQWLKERHITAVITLDKFGAIGTYKDGRDGVILAWPFELEGFVDPTGAGDAFGAGLVSNLSQKANFSFTDFLNAIGEARIWAAYACMSLGGASNCPDKSALQKFRKKILEQEPDPVEVQQMKHIDRILQLLDRLHKPS